jgi:uncharacterized protein (DUF58 family)
MVPSARFIWLVTLLAFPAAIAAGLAPALVIPMVAIIAALFAIAAIDALRRNRVLVGIQVQPPNLARLFKDREAEIKIRVHNPSKQARLLRIGIPAPPGLETPHEERVIDLPADSDTAEFSWSWTPRRRGRYHLDACYLEINSPFGLWSVRRRQKIALEIRVYPNLRRHDDLKALRRGVRLTLLDPDHFSTGLIRLYDEVKQRQLL